MKILVVEDDELICTYLSFYLAKSKHELTIVEELKDAYQTAVNLVPDLIMSDFELAAGNSGQLLAELSQVLPHSGCIVMSGHSREYLEQKMPKLEFAYFEFLAKPFTLPDLKKMLNDYLRHGWPGYISHSVTR